MVQGHHGIGFATVKPEYSTYKSPYGPQYKTQPNIRGIGPGRALKLYVLVSAYIPDPRQTLLEIGITAATFGVVGAVFALQFFSDVPKVRTDICQKLPIVGDYFIRETPPSDNPF